MKPIILKLLADKKEELEVEEIKTARLLHECGVTKESPPKDYWLPVYKLRKQVDLLNQLKEVLE